MDYHIYTIPLWDAFGKNGECPLCDIHRMLEEQYLSGLFNGASMESDIRMATNKKGFCQRHIRQLNELQSVLPLALTLHTHLLDVTAGLSPYLNALDAAIDQEEGAPPASRAIKGLKKNSDIGKAAAALADAARERAESCYICDRVDSGIERYVETIFHMYKTEKDFPRAFAESKGFCLSHLPPVTKAAGEKLTGKTRRDFLRALANAQRTNMGRLAGEIEFFTQKFDYRNADKPWGDAKDAVPRTIQKLTGPALPAQAPPK